MVLEGRYIVISEVKSSKPHDSREWSISYGWNALDGGINSNGDKQQSRRYDVKTKDFESKSTLNSPPFPSSSSRTYPST